MLIQMEPTDHIVTIDGVECRVWNAVTERRTHCFIFVHRIAVPTDETAHPDDQREFEEQFLGWKPVEIREKHEDADS